MADLGKNTQLDNPLKTALSASRNIFIVVGAFSLCINLLMLTVPFYMLQVYDRVLTSRSVDTLWALTVLAGVLLLSNAALEFARSRLLVRVSMRLDNDLRDRVFSSILARRLTGRNAEAHTQPIRDLESLRTFLTGPGLLAFFDAPWTPIFIALIFLFHPLLGSIALFGALALFLLVLGNEFATRGPLRLAAAKSMKAGAFADTSLRNAEVITALGMESNLRARWTEDYVGALALQASASDRAGALTAIVKLLRLGLQVAILGAGAWLAIAEIVSPGVMIAGSIIMGRALAPVETAIGGWRSFIAARSAHGRLAGLLSEFAKDGDAMSLPRPQGNITVQGLTAAPPGVAKPVLKGLNFTVSTGEILAIIGPSAAGKSTLARMLVGVWKPQVGHVRLDGADVSDWNPEELGPHIGYLPQDVELFDGTVADNIARFGAADPEGVVKAARLADVHDMILTLPDGYDTSIGEGGSVISGGQRQRIALARALYGDPALVVLDEPNASLDQEGENALRRAMLAIRQDGTTLIIISHRPSILSASDKMMVLRNGQIELFGPYAEIAKKLMPAPAKTGKEPT